MSTHAANHHEVTLARFSFKFYMIEAKPEKLVGDRDYDSDCLDRELKKDGVQPSAAHRSNRLIPKTQDRRLLCRHARPWIVKRFSAWLQGKRRLQIRWESYATNFPRFVRVACFAMLRKHF